MVGIDAAVNGGKHDCDPAHDLVCVALQGFFSLLPVDER
jgi:hypothetical protein